jgi:MFS family permease
LLNKGLLHIFQGRLKSPVQLSPHSALRSASYRTWLAALFVSQIGTWAQVLAEAWLAYRLSHSVFVLGLIGFAGQLPYLLLAPLSGSLADRFDQRRIVACAQAASCLQAVAMGVFYFRGSTSVPILVLLAVWQGCAYTFDAPARQGLVLRLLADRAHHPSAIGWNQTIFGLTRLIGPTAAGLVIAAYGEGACFIVNALSFLPLLVVLKVIRASPRVQHGAASTYRCAMKFMLARPWFLELLFMMSANSLLLMSYSSVLAAYTKEVLAADVATVGMLSAMAAIGGVTAGTLVGFLSRRFALLSLVRFFLVAGLVGEAGLSLAHTLPLAAPLVVLLGLSITSALVASGQLVHREVTDQLRGRVSSFYFMAVMAPMPFGALMLGGLAYEFDVPRAYQVNAALLLTALIAVAWRRRTQQRAMSALASTPA